MAPSLPSGRYMLINSCTRNAAVLPDGNEGFPLRGCVRGLLEKRRGEEWSVVRLENRNYIIQNIDFNTFAGCDPYPGEKDEVLGKSKPQQWTIKQPFDQSPVCLISPSSNKDLFWGIPMDEDGTPISMSSISTDRRNHWLFKPVDSLQLCPSLDLDSVLPAPSEEMSGGIILHSHTLLRFIQLVSALKVFFRNMTRSWQITHDANFPPIAHSSVAHVLASMVAIFALEQGVGACSALVTTAFFGILCQQLPYSTKIDRSVYIIDLFDERITLSSDIWQSWEKVDKFLKHRQRNRAGYRYVERGDYFITNQDNQLIVPERWAAMIKPGMVLDMGIVLRTFSLAETRQCPRCDTLVVGVSPKDRDIQCTFCPCKFRIWEEKKALEIIASSEMQQRHFPDIPPGSPHVWESNKGSVSSPETIVSEVCEKRMPEERERQFFARIHIILSTFTMPSCVKMDDQLLIIGEEAPLSKLDIVILIMGHSSSGKSKFIETLTQKPTGSRHWQLQPQAATITVSHYYLPTGKRLCLVDFPSFDEAARQDADALGTITTWLAATYKAGIVPTGILFFQRISDHHLTDAAMKNMNILFKLCGNDFLTNVVLVTTMWSRVILCEGEARERTLHQFWERLVWGKPQMARFNNTQKSALDVVRRLNGKNPLPLQIQREMVDQGMVLMKTAVGGALLDDLEREIDKQKDELRKLEKEGTRADEIEKLEEECKKTKQRRTVFTRWKWLDDKILHAVLFRPR